MGRCGPLWHLGHLLNEGRRDGPEGSRTADLLSAKQPWYVRWGRGRICWVRLWGVSANVSTLALESWAPVETVETMDRCSLEIHLFEWQ